MIDSISSFIIPGVLLIPSFLFFSNRKDYFSAFVRGAKQGFDSALNLIPALTLIMCAVSMFSYSGGAGAVSSFLAPFCEKIGVPSDIVPLLLTRPFSGSASNAAYTELLRRCGPDSFSSFAASVIMGSSDTMVYIISVYFSAATHVRHTRYAYPVAVASGLFCTFFSCFICRLFF